MTELLPAKMKRKESLVKAEIKDYLRLYRSVFTLTELTKNVSEKFKRPVARQTISNYLKEIDSEELSQFQSMTSVDLASESRRTYRKIEDEGWRMLLEASSVRDPQVKAQLETNALASIRQSREAQDRMYKYMGITGEKLTLEKVDITGTSQWKTLLKGILIYIRHGLTCPQCGYKGFSVDGMVDFLDAVRRDPSQIELFFSKERRMKQAGRDYQEAEFHDVEGQEEPEEHDAVEGFDDEQGDRDREDP